MHDFGLRLRVVLSLQVVAGLVAVAFPIAPATASDTDYRARYTDYRARQRDYQTCANSLLTAGIVEADAAAACAAALAPRDIADCVTQIDEGTTIAAADVLGGCRQVRRPVELAICVVDISAGTQNAVPLEVLNNCRRSLLPARFSNCVVGISQQTALAPADAMRNCIVAGDRPTNLLPTFVPSSQPIPTTPRSVLDTNTDTDTDTEASPDGSLRLTPLVPMQPSQPTP